MGLTGLHQFALLEERIEALISRVNSLKQEKESAGRRLQDQEEKINRLGHEIETLKAEKGFIRNKVEALLEKIENHTL